MFRDVDKANPMVGVGQESGAGFHRLEDATLVFDSQVNLNTAALCY